MDDETLANCIENDAFHTGLAEHGEFTGFIEPALKGIRMKLSELEYMTDSKIEFADTLTLHVCARLPRCETLDGGILRGASAFGDTKKEARKALAEALSNETLVKNAYSTGRMEWKLPKVTAG